jgi:DnaB helicase-like protein/AAA domain-containing protein
MMNRFGRGGGSPQRNPPAKDRTLPDSSINAEFAQAHFEPPRLTDDFADEWEKARDRADLIASLRRQLGEPAVEAFTLLWEIQDGGGSFTVTAMAKLKRKQQPLPPPPPPHDPEAEKAILSSIMIFGGEAISQCVEAGVQVEWFFVPAHKTIYQELVDVYDSEGKIELISFTKRLAHKKLLDAIGGEGAVANIEIFLYQLHNVVWSIADLPDRIESVRACYQRRQLIAMAKLADQRAYDRDPDADIDAFLDEIASKAASLRSLHGRNHGISFRSPAEILTMPRDPHANFLGDRLLGVALSLVMAGIGGIGKSRLFLQLLVAFILERLWCGMETHHTKGKRWMLIQTQNGNSRLQDDLEPLRKYAGRDWSLVEKNLLIHTLETDRDLMLHLSDPKNARDLESEIRRRNPIGVAFDPLNDVAIGDLSKDVDMSTTCRAIGRVSRAGNPERAILIATHALTGRAGMRKAFGFEAAGFGRNSKVLQTWARAFINIVPATEDYSILVLTCGKNNNGKMFEPCAVRLNPDTMIYEPEPDFDIESFREGIEKPKKQRPTFKAEIIRDDVEWSKPELSTVELVRAIKAASGCGGSRAYELVDEARARGFIKFSKITKTYSKK